MKEISAGIESAIGTNVAYLSYDSVTKSIIGTPTSIRTDKIRVYANDQF